MSRRWCVCWLFFLQFHLVLTDTFYNFRMPCRLSIAILSSLSTTRQLSSQLLPRHLFHLHQSSRRKSTSCTMTTAANDTISIASNPSLIDDSKNNRSTAFRTSDVLACANHLKKGGLVAFPTETVYGLGCSALNEKAIQAVFDAKERPLTDPLIVHVLTAVTAFELWQATCRNNQKINNTHLDCDSLEAKILRALCDHFWPGPLTLVARANLGAVPPKIMAGTGFVACRSPQHTAARQLIELSQLPLAAPSANKFGHVSPTTADHVWDDLQNEDVWILENLGQSCQVGVESTVAKVESKDLGEGFESHCIVTVLRQGAVSASQIDQCLRDAEVLTDAVKVTSKLQATADHTANVAPGQTLRHYSPNLLSFLISKECLQHTSPSDTVLNTAVILDYAGRMASWKDTALAYRDLSLSGNASEAAYSVFDCLRWAERVSGANFILFPDLEIYNDDQDHDALLMALKDRLTRAASGVVIDSLRDIR